MRASVAGTSLFLLRAGNGTFCVPSTALLRPAHTSGSRAEEYDQGVLCRSTPGQMHCSGSPTGTYESPRWRWLAHELSASVQPSELAISRALQSLIRLDEANISSL